MKTETFGELLGSMKEALEQADGKRNLRTTTMPLPPPPLDGRAVKRARAALHASQAVFARYSEREHQARSSLGSRPESAGRAGPGPTAHRRGSTRAHRSDQAPGPTSDAARDEENVSESTPETRSRPAA